MRIGFLDVSEMFSTEVCKLGFRRLIGRCAALGAAAACVAATIDTAAANDAVGSAKNIVVAAKTATKSKTAASGTLSIVALVNDEPITGYEVQQRSMMLSGGDIGKQAQANFQALIKNPKTTDRLKAILDETIKSNPGKSRDEIIAIFERRKKEFGMSLQKQAVESARASALPGVRKAALDELIDEKIKLQEAKRQNVTIGDDEVTRIITGIAERNKMTLEQFQKQLGNGFKAMKTRIQASLAFNEVVRRRFGSQITVTMRDVDRFVASTGEVGADSVELHLQRIRIAIPAKLEQGNVAQKIAEAEQIRAKFTGCKTMGQIAGGVAGAKYEDIGRRRPSAIAEPTRTMLMNAADGEMLPPNVGEGGVELWAVCGRTVLKAEDQKRNEAEGELKQKEFELLAKRHLRDLRQDAHIEYR